MAGIPLLEFLGDCVFGMFVGFFLPHRLMIGRIKLFSLGLNGLDGELLKNLQ